MRRFGHLPWLLITAAGTGLITMGGWIALMGCVMVGGSVTMAYHKGRHDATCVRFVGGPLDGDTFHFDAQNIGGISNGADDGDYVFDGPELVGRWIPRS